MELIQRLEGKMDGAIQELKALVTEVGIIKERLNGVVSSTRTDENRDRTTDSWRGKLKENWKEVILLIAVGIAGERLIQGLPAFIVSIKDALK